MTDQFPDAQAVLDAVLDVDLCIEFTDLDATVEASVRSLVAAALRAAAMKTLLTSEHYQGSTPTDYELGWNAAVAYIQNIATELEGQS